MFVRALRIVCGILSVPIALFVMFGSVFLLVANPTITDVVEFYFLSLLSAVLGMTALGLWERWARKEAVLMTLLLSVTLLLTAPVLFWLFVVVPQYVLG